MGLQGIMRLEQTAFTHLLPTLSPHQGLTKVSPCRRDIGCRRMPE